MTVVALGANHAEAAWILSASTLVSAAGSTVAVAFRRAAGVFGAVAGVLEHPAHTQHRNREKQRGRQTSRHYPDHGRGTLGHRSRPVNFTR